MGFVNGKDGHLSRQEINLIAQLSDIFPGTSDLIYNTSVYYETDRLSMCLNYNDAVDVLYVGTAATPSQVERYGRHHNGRKPKLS